MVHALKEAWRVLAPAGVMVDVRPLSQIIPLEVAYEDKRELAGMADNTPDRAYDLAADEAIGSVVSEGKFSLQSLETFDFVYYWKTYHGMVRDFADRWEGEIVVTQEVLENARKLYRRHRPIARMRLPMPMKLGKYRKESN